jgi:hypothetical protein
MSKPQFDIPPEFAQKQPFDPIAFLIQRRAAATYSVCLHIPFSNSPCHPSSLSCPGKENLTHRFKLMLQTSMRMLSLT